MEEVELLKLLKSKRVGQIFDVEFDDGSLFTLKMLGRSRGIENG